MAIGLDELKAAAAKLTVSERAELAYALIQSLDSDPEGEDEFEIQRAWLTEAKRRAGNVARGEVKPIPGDDVFARPHRKFG